MHHRGNVVKHWHNLCYAPWDRDTDRAMRPGMEPVVNSTVKILGNGWHPRQQAKPFLKFLFLWVGPAHKLSSACVNLANIHGSWIC